MMSGQITRNKMLLAILFMVVIWSMWPSPSIRNFLQEVEPPKGAVETGNDAKIMELGMGRCAYRAKIELRYSGLGYDVKEEYQQVFLNIATELGFPDLKFGEFDRESSSWSATIADLRVVLGISREPNDEHYTIGLIVPEQAEKLGFQCT